MNIIDEAFNYAKDFFKDESSGHDFAHTKRVYDLANMIAKKEKADMEIVSLAALLHDVDDVKLSPSTSENKDNARSFLEKNNYDHDKIEIIIKIIDEVSFKGSDSALPKTIEGKCVQDADRLDAIGAIGIARCFQFGGSHNRVMYDPNIKPKLNMNEDEYRKNKNTTLNHFYEKLFLLKDMMNTKTAKKLAKKRHKIMEDFVNNFIKEWNI